MTRRAAALLGAGLLLFAACRQPAPPPGASGPEADSYFPLVAGARWVYGIELGPLAHVELEVVGQGQQAVRGLEGMAFIMSERNLGESFGMVEVSPTAYVIAEGFVSRYQAVDYDDSGAVRLLGREDPTWILPVETVAGKVWSQHTRIFEQPEGGGGSIRWTGRTLALPSLAVPAGSFRDVLKVEIEYWDDTQSPERPLLAYEDYYARGVGLLRSLTFNESEGHRQIVEQSLLRYEFPHAAAD